MYKVIKKVLPIFFLINLIVLFTHFFRHPTAITENLLYQLNLIIVLGAHMFTTILAFLKDYNSKPVSRVLIASALTSLFLLLFFLIII